METRRPQTGGGSIMGRDKQLDTDRDLPESRQEIARGMGQTETGDATTEPDERPPSEQQAESR